MAIVLSVFSFVGCSRRVVESPNDNNNTWGFNNQKQEAENTYDDKNATIAELGSFTYYSSDSFRQLVEQNIIGTAESNYATNYQTTAKEQLELLKDSKTYTIDNPLLIHNPFGTNVGGLYVFLGSPSYKINLYYKVSIEDATVPDYYDTMYINRTTSDIVEGQMIGLIPGYKNKVVIEIRNVDGTRINKRAYYIDVPANTIANPMRLKIEESEHLSLARGLFSFLVQYENQSYFLFYDNKGILRAEIPTKTKNEEAKILQTDNRIFFEYDRNQYVLLDNLGNVVDTYQWKENSHLLDYDYDETNNIILFLEAVGEKGHVQRVVQLDLAKKEWKETCDFKKLMPDYEKLIDAKQDILHVTKEDDFFKFNSIQSANGKDLLVCSKELSTIIRVNNIYFYPVIRWMIGEEELWKDTEYESLLLFETQGKTVEAGIDSLTYMKNKQLKEDQCYLAFINYNIANKHTPASESNVIKYLVDENQNRYRIVLNIPFPYHSDRCSAMVYGNHVILSLGQEKQFIEYDDKGEMMLRFTIPNINSSYRVIKYIMDRYWF